MKITKKIKDMKLGEKFAGLKEKAAGAARKIGAKNMIIICAVLVCGVAIGLNFILSGGGKENDGGYKIDPNYYAALLEEDGTGEGTSDVDASPEPASPVRDEYFDTAAYNRDRARDEAIQVLSTVVDNETALQEVRDQAGADIAALAANMSAEANIEELVKAKGVADCVAIINGENVSVIVKSDGLLPNEVAQISEIVYQQSGILPSNMSIFEK